MCVYIYIYIYIVMLLTLSEGSACQAPIRAVAAGALTIHTRKCFLGAGFIGALPTSLRRRQTLSSKNFK